MSTPGWVQDIVLEEYGPPLVIGQEYDHPEHGLVKVTGGCFFDPVYGRLSNWWTWVDASGAEHRGYGGWQNVDRQTEGGGAPG